jgi:hypothetical protein
MGCTTGFTIPQRATNSACSALILLTRWEPRVVLRQPSVSSRQLCGAHNSAIARRPTSEGSTRLLLPWANEQSDALQQQQCGT